MSEPINDAQPEHPRHPRDWTLPLIGMFVLAFVVDTSVVRLLPLNAPYYSYELFRLGIGASLGLMGVAFGAPGMLLWRRSPRVRLLSRLARDPRGTGIVYVGMAVGLLVGGIAQAISAIPGEAAVYILFGGMGIVPGLLLYTYYMARYVEHRRRREGRTYQTGG